MPGILMLALSAENGTARTMHMRFFSAGSLVLYGDLKALTRRPRFSSIFRMHSAITYAMKMKIMNPPRTQPPTSSISLFKKSTVIFSFSCRLHNIATMIGTGSFFSIHAWIGSQNHNQVLCLQVYFCVGSGQEMSRKKIKVSRPPRKGITMTALITKSSRPKTGASSTGFRESPYSSSSSKISTDPGKLQQHLEMACAELEGQQLPTKPAPRHCGCFSQSWSVSRRTAPVSGISHVSTCRRERVSQSASFLSSMSTPKVGHIET
mmetsp:Transcript_67960/g.145480  ORF Transcript_67960/g.145480 Transcript_67960/m.145480 type:complete len:264 (-) Transcript_67960:521-1312(-)